MLPLYKYILYLIAISFSSFFAIPTIHAIIDRWRVLNIDFHHAYNIESPHPRVNAGYLRTSHLIENKDQFDSIIFGSSRVFHGFGTLQLNETLKGKWYKFTTPGAAPYEHLHNLKVLLKHNVKLDRIIIALDDADIYRHRNNIELYNFYPYPLNTLDKFNFYKFYLFKKITHEDAHILAGRQELIKYPWTIEKYVKYGYQHATNLNLNTHQDRLNKIPPHGLNLSRLQPRTDKLIQTISEFIEISKSNNIKITFLINPRYYRTLLCRDFIEIENFKIELAQVTEFYDFTELLHFHIDAKYWLDTSHFTSEVGSQILNCLANQVSNSNDFGVLVTSSTVHSNIQSVRNSVSRTYQKSLNSNSKLYIHDSLHSFLSTTHN